MFQNIAKTEKPNITKFSKYYILNTAWLKPCTILYFIEIG